jgi:hypothetical protein
MTVFRGFAVAAALFFVLAWVAVHRGHDVRAAVAFAMGCACAVACRSIVAIESSHDAPKR